MQGLCMSTAFALMLSYLGEACNATDVAGAFAAYITGNVASNLFGRLMSASIADHFGLAANFFVFAGLNLAGAVLVFVLIGMSLVAIGTFLAQATATAYVGRAATTDHGSASGIYLACYFFGGLVGTAVLGQVFDRLGWWACVAGIGGALAVAAVLATRLRLTSATTH